MARILVPNIYDLAPSRRAVAEGRAPDHLLYGLNHFERHGHTVGLVPFQATPTLRALTRATRRCPVPVGRLDQEIPVLRAARDADLIYCPTQAVGQLLAYLRAAGRLTCPLVFVVHHPIDDGRLSRLRRPLTRALLRGVDAYPALTAPVADAVVADGGEPSRTAALPFGPDPDWYPRDDRSARGVIVAGVMRRDMDTFVRGAVRTSVPTTIVCEAAGAPSVSAGNVRVVLRPPGGRIAPAQLTELYAAASIIAVPLHVGWPWSVNGLLSIADALGMGKALVVTRHPLLDIDVDALGIGLSVAPGDAEGWRAAIEYLDRRPELAAAMGARARALVDSGRRSSAAFAGRLLEVFDQVLSASA